MICYVLEVTSAAAETTPCETTTGSIADDYSANNSNNSSSNISSSGSSQNIKHGLCLTEYVEEG